jgi:hypothetical protein
MVGYVILPLIYRTIFYIFNSSLTELVMEESNYRIFNLGLDSGFISFESETTVG